MDAAVFLKDVTSADVVDVGGKGANLGELIRNHFPVPPGFVITAGCYRDTINKLGALPDLDTLEAFRARITRAALSPDLMSAIASCDAELRREAGKPFVYAVRSSATAEDLADASFAGQHETYYYVSADKLHLMIRKCWASLWSDAAWSYRMSHGIDHASVNMAVVVQRMVQSDVSGVTFTADPVTANEKTIVTESCWGMGAALVDGRVSPDRYTVDRESRHIVAVRIADKRFMVPPSLSSDATSRLTVVEADRRRIRTLSDSDVQEVSEWAVKAAQHFGTAQDLEWAIEDNRFYLLQSRPITVMGAANEALPRGKYVLFKAVAENFTDPLLPLTRDIFSRLFPMTTFIYGRFYLPFGLFRALIPFKLDDADIAKIAYLADVDSPRISWWRLAPLALFAAFNYLTMNVLYLRLQNLPASFMSSFRERFRQVVADPAIDAPGAFRELLLAPRFFEPVGNMVLLNNLAAPRYIFYILFMKQLLARWVPGLREDAASFLCSGDPEILSTDMGRRIWRLAAIAREVPTVRSILVDSPPARAVAELEASADSADFLAALRDFLAVHGHRSLKEFELNSARWEEDPTPVIAMIRNYLLSDVDPQTTEARVERERNELWQQIESRLVSWRVSILRHIGSRARYLIRLRENSRFYHIMGFYAVRIKLLEIEELLLASGRLKCKDDIFYLTWDETTALRDGRLTWLDVEDTIRERRMEYIRLGKISAPKTVGIDLPEDTGTPSGDKLEGQGASPGSYEGIARVIMDPAVSAELMPGEILVAPYTDPAWTPLFLTAHAAVVEVGSFLSHAGTIAREYGMPCVVDVADCTRRIKSGDRIRVDGSRGEVALLELADA